MANGMFLDIAQHRAVCYADCIASMGGPMGTSLMAITSDQELKSAVAQASDLVQKIQDYCGRSLRDESKIRFPRGMIGTADSYRTRCPSYLDLNTISSHTALLGFRLFYFGVSGSEKWVNLSPHNAIDDYD
jgi:hypothetical protein